MSFKVSGNEHSKIAREEVERRREVFFEERDKATLEQERESLSKAVRISDEETLDDLLALGFNPENVGVLPLVPLIAVAWADGSVSTREQKRILDLAEQRGVTPDKGAYRLLDSLLNEASSSAFLHSCIYVLRKVYDSLAPNAAKKAKENMVKFAYVVAEASGGVLGLFGNKVCDEEQELIDQIAGWLGVNESENTENVHRLVAVLEDDDEAEEEGEPVEDPPEAEEEDAAYDTPAVEEVKVSEPEEAHADEVAPVAEAPESEEAPAAEEE